MLQDFFDLVRPPSQVYLADRRRRIDVKIEPKFRKKLVQMCPRKRRPINSARKFADRSRWELYQTLCEVAEGIEIDLPQELKTLLNADIAASFERAVSTFLDYWAAGVVAERPDMPRGIWAVSDLREWSDWCAVHLEPPSLATPRGDELAMDNKSRDAGGEGA